MRIVFLGPPGAGKGTQAKAAAQRYAVPHVSSGDIFRAEIARASPLGQKIKSYVDSGRLVPDEVTTEAVTQRLAEDDCAGGWVLDGFPRTEGQARALDEALERSRTKLDAVAYLALDAERIVERMAGRRVCPKCGRPYHRVHLRPRSDERCDECGVALVRREDDAPETVRERLATYQRQTAPLVEYYDRRGLLRRVDGEGTPDEVRDRLFEKLEDSVEGA